MHFSDAKRHSIILQVIIFLAVMLFTVNNVAQAGNPKTLDLSHDSVVTALKNEDSSKAIHLIRNKDTSLWLVSLRSFKEVAEPNLKVTVVGGNQLAMYPLLAAVAATGNTGVAKALLEKGARVDHRLQGEGSTAIMFAAKNHHLEMVQFLLDNGANPALFTMEKRPSCALMFSLEHMESGNEELVALALLQSPHAEQTLQQLTPIQLRATLETASYNGLLQVISRFNELGIPLTGKNWLGASLLHYALMGGTKGGESVALYLVQQGLDPNQHYANDRLLQMSQTGASIEDKNREGKTPLLIGIDEGVSAQFVEQLILLGADGSVPSLGQVTPLQAARKAGRDDIVEVLEKHGVK